MTEDLGEAERLIREYPWLQEIYEEIAMLRRKPEEVLGMFSEALKILDQNTIKYMINEKDTIISQRDTLIEAQKEKIAKLQKQLEDQLRAAGRTKEGMSI